MKKATLLILFICLPLCLKAEQPQKGIDGGALTLSSAYLWRGEQVCNLHFNPYLAFHAGSFCLEPYSFLALDGAYKEIDWDLSYTAGPFTFHLADYYWRYGNDPAPENFFSWKKGETHHIDEAAIVYRSSAFPFKATWFTFFWGDWIPAGMPGAGNLSLSSYLELEAWHEFGDYGKGVVNFGASVLRGSYTGYSKDFMPIHLALSYGKSIPVGGVSILLKFNFVINPYRKLCMAGTSIGVEF